MTGATIHARDLTVQASAANGRYVAWWPGQAFDPDGEHPGGEAGPGLLITYNLTLLDGTFIHNVEPARPR